MCHVNEVIERQAVGLEKKQNNSKDNGWVRGKLGKNEGGSKKDK